MLAVFFGCAQGPATDAPALPSPAPVRAVHEETSAVALPDAPALPVEDLSVPIVIGAGPSGLAAAADLGEAVIFEASDAVGGRAQWAGGFLFLAGTPEQAAGGVDDSPERAAEDWEALTGEPPTSATYDFLDALPDVRQRLVDQGVTLALGRTDPVTGLVREHAPDGGGPALVSALSAALPDGVELRLATPVEGLVLVDGRAAGIRTAKGWIRSDTVVIASGGFVDRADLLALSTGWADGAWRMGEPTLADGDALDWAAESGLGTARLSAIGSFRDILGIPGADGNAMAVTTGATVPWIWVDATGERFVDESATWSVALAGLSSAREPVWALTTYELLAARVSPDDLPYLHEQDGFHCAATWEDLAAVLEIPDATLVTTVDNSVSAVETRSVDGFGRAPAASVPLVGTPCAFRPGWIAAKNYGGLAVDDDGRVLDPDGRVIPGLWAVGEAAGMGVPGLGGAWGFDGSLSAVIWSGWRTAAAIGSE